MLFSVVLSGCSIKLVNVVFQKDNEVIQSVSGFALFNKIEVVPPQVQLASNEALTGWKLNENYSNYSNVCKISNDLIVIDLSNVSADKIVFDAIITLNENNNSGGNGGGGNNNEVQEPYDEIPSYDPESIEDATVKQYIKGNCSSAYSAFYTDKITTNARVEALQAVYRELVQVSILFSENKTNATQKPVDKNQDGKVDEFYYEVAEIDISEYNLNMNEVCIVFGAFRMDSPYFYWLSHSFRYEYISFSDKVESIILVCDEEYATATARSAIQTMLENEVARYDRLLIGKTSRQKKAEVFHDEIIKRIDYKYDSNNNPSLEPGAHNIVGVLDKTGVVCEGYARMFQYLCNYYDIPNRYVVGNAMNGLLVGEYHAWNLFMADDGKYYWVDCTWDDDKGLFVNKTYFADGDISFRKTHRIAGFGNDSRNNDIDISKYWTNSGKYDYYINWQQKLPTNISTTKL